MCWMTIVLGAYHYTILGVFYKMYKLEGIDNLHPIEHTNTFGKSSNEDYFFFSTTHIYKSSLREVPHAAGRAVTPRGSCGMGHPGQGSEG